ncbi:MAG: hypothetical protein M1831_003218 [Alyxoria varia]|nr:MAG: hypothetical protein M1831_003218 [Alyxoria varia]
MANSRALVIGLATLAAVAWLIAVSVFVTKHMQKIKARKRPTKPLKGPEPAASSDPGQGSTPEDSPQVDNPLTSRRSQPDQRSPVSSRWSRDSRFGVFFPRNAIGRLEAAILRARMTGSSSSNSGATPSIGVAATPVTGSSSNGMNHPLGGGSPLTLPAYSPPPPSYKTQVSRLNIVDLESGMVDVAL